MPRDHRAYVESLTQDEFDELRSAIHDSQWNRHGEETIGKRIVSEAKKGPVNPRALTKKMQMGEGEIEVAGGMRAEENLTGRRPTDEEVDRRRQTWKRPVEGQKFSGR